MKKIMKKSLSLVMALAVMLTGVLVIPTAGDKAADITKFLRQPDSIL